MGFEAEPKDKELPRFNSTSRVSVEGNRVISTCSLFGKAELSCHPVERNTTAVNNAPISNDFISMDLIAENPHQCLML